MRPLLQLQDEHVLATLSAVVMALKEGRTGLPIGGVFGAGKTRFGAVLLAGLLVFDPSLKLMVVTKENVAAHAFAEHLVALRLPQEVQDLMGRLVGYYEQRRKGSGAPLDLPIENRNNHIRQKSLLIGCGGGYLQECGQPYSPVSDWIKQADIVLEDEGQQYGNMEEAFTIARTPRTCFEIWSGDHRQTPGGLQQTDEAKKFRRKLLRRPLALISAIRNTYSRMGLLRLLHGTWRAMLAPRKILWLASWLKQTTHRQLWWTKFGRNCLDMATLLSIHKSKRQPWLSYGWRCKETISIRCVPKRLQR
ncbi:MAG: hypothetical protein OIF54_17400, partial [Cohaesibacter sp.]|nr:hypothetical protein [Cohaesibacter sp.]